MWFLLNENGRRAIVNPDSDARIHIANEERLVIRYGDEERNTPLTDKLSGQEAEKKLLELAVSLGAIDHNFVVGGNEDTPAKGIRQ